MNQILLQETEKVLNNAIASVEIEGYKLSDDEKELCMEVLNGKLTKDDFIKIMLERCTVSVSYTHLTLPTIRLV